MTDYSDDDLQAMQDYANGVVGDGSKLLDLPGGGAMVRDPGGYTALVQRPSGYDNTIDSTDNANDMSSYKAYLAQHPDARPFAQAQTNDASDSTSAAPDTSPSPPKWLTDYMQAQGGPQAQTAPAAHVMLADAIPVDQAPAPKTDAQDAVKARYLELFKQFPANGSAQQRAVNKAMVSQYETELNAAKVQDERANYAALKSATMPKGKADSGAQKGARVMADFGIPADFEQTVQSAGVNSGATATDPRQSATNPVGQALSGAERFIAHPSTIPQAASATNRQIAQDAQQAARGAQRFAQDPSTIPQAIDKTNQQIANMASQAGDVVSKVAPYSAPGILLNAGKGGAPANAATATAPAGVTPDASGNASPVVAPHYVGGGFARTISPTAQAMAEDALGEPRQRELSDQEVNARLFNQQAIAQAGQQAGAAYAEQERARAERARTQAVMQKHQDDLDAANKAYQAAQIDPNRLFKNRSTGDNIMSAIGVALGAFGASINHTPNFALEIVNKAIDGDIEAQKAELAKKGQGAQNALSQLRESTGSYENADNAYRLAALQYAKSKADELNAKGTDTALQQQLGNQIEQLKLQNLQHREATERYVPPQLIGGTPGVSDAEREKTVQLPVEMGGYPAGTRLIANDPKSAEKLRTAAEGYSILSSLSQQVKALEKQYGSDIYVEGSKGNNAYMSLVTNAVSQAGHVNAVAKQPIVDTDMLREQLTPHGYNALGIGPSVSDRFNAAVNAYKSSSDAFLKAEAPEVAHRYVGVTPSGRVVPGAEYTGDAPMPRAMPKGFTPVGGTGSSSPSGRVLQQKPDVRRIPEPAPKGVGRGRAAARASGPPLETEADDDDGG